MNNTVSKLATLTCSDLTSSDLTRHPSSDTRIVHQHVTRWRSQFRDDVLGGLRATPRHLSSLYFYDDQGSALFDEITRLPEYYLTRCEQAILQTHANDIVNLIANEPVCIVDLGAGSGEKTRCLIECLSARGVDTVYAPLDVSQAALQSAAQSMRTHFPTLRVDAVQGEYVAGLARIRKAQPGRRLLVLWLGSSIGNLSDPDAVDLLRELAAACASEDVFLIGFDLLKDPKTLIAAYDDSRGVTAEFNYNLLRRINRELDGNFKPEDFLHYATFSPLHSRMESYLLSRKQQTVTVADRDFIFAAWEPIQTEISSKYTHERIGEILRQAGLVSLATFSDDAEKFSDVACMRREVSAPKAVQ